MQPLEQPQTNLHWMIYLILKLQNFEPLVSLPRSYTVSIWATKCLKMFKKYFLCFIRRWWFSGIGVQFPFDSPGTSIAWRKCHPAPALSSFLWTAPIYELVKMISPPAEPSNRGFVWEESPSQRSDIRILMTSYFSLGRYIIMIFHNASSQILKNVCLLAWMQLAEKIYMNISAVLLLHCHIQWCWILNQFTLNSWIQIQMIMLNVFWFGNDFFPVN